MAITQRGSATSATNANVVDGGTLACSKPTGVVDGDVLLAWVTRNDRTLTPPSGWTQVDEQMISTTSDHFATTVFSHVASSDGSTYSWTVSGATGAPMVITIVAFSGVDTSLLVGGDTMVAYTGNQTEPLTTGTTTNTGGPKYIALYSRSARIAGSTPITFSTAGAATELDDTGIFSGGTTSYSQAVYLANAEATASTVAALTITASGTETHTITTVLSLIDATQDPVGGASINMQQALVTSNFW